MNAPMHFMPPADFRARVSDALQDTKLRGSMRGAMDFLQDKRRAQFPDGDELEQLRDLGEAVRQHALANLPQLLVQFEAKLQAAGTHVHWAANADEANAIIMAGRPLSQVAMPITPRRVGSERIRRRSTMAASLR